MRAVACLVMSVVLGGCAARSLPADGDVAARAAAPEATPSAAGPAESLEVFMAKMRALTANATPRTRGAETVESRDPQLRDALEAYGRVASPDTSRAVAGAYARLGIFDQSYQFYMRALQLEPGDAGAYDGLARLWRDSGFPHLGLPDAHRAVFHAPDSPIAHNTLGTVLQALGQGAAARREYERAVELDPGAFYALNNLCYGWLLEGETALAIDACRRAIQLKPDMNPAQNNLALALAAEGDLDGARAAFAAAGNRSEALFNTGIVHLARREYAEAVTAFMEAHRSNPSLRGAMVRARQAATHLNTASEEE